MRTRLPRHVLALTTVALFTWLGLSLLGANNVVAGVLLGLAALRLGRWVYDVVRQVRASD